MVSIIFGANGQDGIYLSGLLQKEGYDVLSVGRSDTVVSVADFGSVCELVKQNRPSLIFHFAANSTTRHNAWQENHETISTGSFNILEAVKLHSPDTKVFLSGSGLQFLNEAKPIKETDPFDASSPYSVSRIHSVYTARYYRKMGLKVYVGYFFNHDSPYRTDRHVNKKIVEVVKRIKQGSNEKLQIGDLTVQKEFGYAEDIVKGVLTLVGQDNVFEAVIGTGVAHTIEEWVDICFSSNGLNWKNHTERVPNFNSEYKILVSEPATIFSLGWQPETGIEKLAKMMLEL